MPQFDIFLAFGMPAGSEWLIILVIALLLFGRRLPEIMRGLGGSVREFKKGIDQGPAEEAKPPPPPAGTAARDAQPPAPRDPNTPNGSH